MKSSEQAAPCGYGNTYQGDDDPFFQSLRDALAEVLEAGPPLHLDLTPSALSASVEDADGRRLSLSVGPDRVALSRGGSSPSVEPELQEAVAEYVEEAGWRGPGGRCPSGPAVAPARSATGSGHRAGGRGRLW